jgi:hypothetical protein
MKPLKPTKRFPLKKDSKPARLKAAQDELDRRGFNTRAFQTLTCGECRFTLEAWL